MKPAIELIKKYQSMPQDYLYLNGGQVYGTFTDKQIETITQPFDLLKECVSKISCPIGEHLLVIISLPPAGERNCDIHFVIPFMEIIHIEAEYHYVDLISSASVAYQKRFGRVGRHSDYIFGREFGNVENSGPDTKDHYDKSTTDFLRVIKVAHDQNSALLQVVNLAAGGSMDANLQLIVNKISLIGICIVGYTIRVYVVFYLGNGVWISDEEVINNAKKIFSAAITYACNNRELRKSAVLTLKHVTDHDIIDEIPIPTKKPWV
ncbi:14085_t:CDS:2 [Entrophospora sp. SA101]|nr:14085_t:CDS:2 [Entrophospora sp. SA101]